MSANKKRKQEVEVEDLAMEATTPRRARLLATRTNSPTGKSALTDAFLENKRSLWQQHMERLNEDFVKNLLQTPSPEVAVARTCEFLRVKQDVENLYHRPQGQVVAMGSDDCSQLGVSTDPDADKKMEYSPTLVRNLPYNVIQVACGGIHSVALTEFGDVYTWGCNDDFALGRGDVAEEYLVTKITEGFGRDQGQIVAIDAGDSHTLFLSMDGNVYSCGMYKDMDSGKFKDVPPGSTKCKGVNEIPFPVAMPQPVRAIASGFTWNAAILADDSLVTWGK
jgi:alpha-tubulin suppressor-like RCC1 family protein